MSNPNPTYKDIITFFKNGDGEKLEEAILISIKAISYLGEFENDLFTKAEAEAIYYLLNFYSRIMKDLHNIDYNI